MEKRWMLCALLVLLLCLTGCEVHWNGESAHVPWFVIAIPAALVVLIGMAIQSAQVSSTRYVCPKCHHTFKPVRWRCMLAPHVDNEYLLRCPQCHAREYCHPSYDQDP